MKGDERNELLAIADSLGQPNTWLPPEVSPTGRARFLRCLESTAKRLTSFSPDRFPSQLQSTEYVRFLAAKASGSQEYTYAQFFIGEAVFTNNILPAEMTTALLHDVIRLAVRPNIQIRVVPESIDIPDSQSFTYMTFAEHSPLVHIQAMNTSGFLEYDTALTQARHIVNAIDEQALSEVDTIPRLTALAAAAADSAYPPPADAKSNISSSSGALAEKRVGL